MLSVSYRVPIHFIDVQVGVVITRHEGWVEVVEIVIGISQSCMCVVGSAVVVMWVVMIVIVRRVELRLVTLSWVRIGSCYMLATY